MPFDGMNVDSIRKIGEDLKKQATALEAVRGQVDRLVDSSQQNWGGKDARDFAGWWRNEHRPRLEQLRQLLDGLGTSAKNNADEQERASNGGGSAGGTESHPTPREESRDWLATLPKVEESWRDSLRLVNPHYGDFSQDLSGFFAGLGLLDSSGEYRNNCGYSSVAYDMRRRGYDVVAQPDLDGDTLAAIASAYRDPVTGESGQWVQARDKASAISTMADYGPGSRAIVTVSWKDGTGGHAFIVENMDGRVVFLDPQSNTQDVGDYFNRIEPGTIRILRTDDLEPNMNPMKFTMVATPDDK